METGESNSTSSNQSCAVMKDSKWYTQFRNVSNPWMARYVYGLIFLVANLLAWAARDELSSLSALTEMKGKIALILYELSHPITITFRFLLLLSNLTMSMP